MTTRRILILAPILALLAAAPAVAGIGEPTIDNFTGGTALPASLVVLPDGSGRPLSEAFFFGAGTIDVGCTFRVLDGVGLPIEAFPHEDIWLDAGTGNFATCPGTAPLWADHDTDGAGYTGFSGVPAGGGSTEGPVMVFINGAVPLSVGGPSPVLDLRFNSPDLNGDGRVNLTDVPVFAGDYFGPYAYRSDFRWDGTINLSDLVVMAAGLGHDCP